MTPRIAAIAGTVVCLLGASSAAQASTHHTKPKPITRAQAAKQYLADVAPVNAAENVAKAQPQPVTISAGVKVLTPVVAANTKFESLVLRQQWPAGDKADIKALVVAYSVYNGDLNSWATTRGDSAWQTTTSRDRATASADANIVRADLGLAPPIP
jgi:hypothetical protein